MEKIKLTQRSKEIFRLMCEEKYRDMYKEEDNAALTLLEHEGLIILETNKYGVIDVYPSNKGLAYFHVNPKLKNPTLWDDKKYIITTSISVVALIISGLSLYFSLR